MEVSTQPPGSQVFDHLDGGGASHLLRNVSHCDPAGLLDLLTDCLSVCMPSPSEEEELALPPPSYPYELTRGRFFRNPIAVREDQATQTAS